MSHQVLSLKWRPQVFDQVKGQGAILASLQNNLQNQIVHNCYLFKGTHGIGKTTLARILAKSLNCEQGISANPCAQCETCKSIEMGYCPDVLEIDAASKTKVDDTRDLLDSISYAPVKSRFKIYIIDEVHMLSTHSFNALLKTIEEPPAHVKFILATTDFRKIPVTILSRSSQYHLKDLSTTEISAHLSTILTSEQISFSIEAIAYIADLAHGSMRDALTICEQVISYNERTLALETCEAMFGARVEDKLLALIEVILKQQNSLALEQTKTLLTENIDLLYALQKMQSILFSVSLLQLEPSAQIDWPVAKITSLAHIATARSLQVCYQAVVNGARDLAFVPDQKIGFQMIILRMLAFQSPQENKVATNQSGQNRLAPIQEPKVASSQLQQARPAPIAHAQPMANLQPEQARPIIKPVQEIPPKMPVQATTVAPISQPNPNIPTAITSPIKPEIREEQLANSTINWDKVIGLLELKGLTKVIAENCILVSHENQHVKLQLDPSYKPLLTDKISLSIAQALSLHYNKPIEVSITIEHFTTQSPAMLKKQLNDANQQMIRENVINNANVIALQQMLDAKLENINLIENS